MLQLEKQIRTHLNLALKQKDQRMDELKTLIRQDQELCDVLCEIPYVIDPERVPSAQQLEDYGQHIVKRNQEKVKWIGRSNKIHLRNECHNFTILCITNKTRNSLYQHPTSEVVLIKNCLFRSIVMQSL